MLRYLADENFHGDIVRGAVLRKPDLDLVRVQDAHDRRKCRDFNGTDTWACGDCDCTRRLEEKLQTTGSSFLQILRKAAGNVG